MTNKDFLDKQPKYGIITNKQILSALKRKGLIYDYSAFGYLEGCWIEHPYDDVNYNYRGMQELFPDGDAPKQRNNFYESRDKCPKNGTIEYLGHKFDLVYLDGCFCPYLQKIDGENEVKPRMSFFGAII